MSKSGKKLVKMGNKSRVLERLITSLSRLLLFLFALKPLLSLF